MSGVDGEELPKALRARLARHQAGAAVRADTTHRPRTGGYFGDHAP
jgi:hypothetical protein